MSLDYPDSTKVLMIEDEYPYMKLVTDKVVHLQAKGKDNTQPCGIIQNGESLAMRYRYLPLETTDECLIGQIDQIDSDGSSIFLFDEKNYSAYRFSLEDGSFICKYGTQGRGPGEYISLNCMAIDKKKKEVCLLDFELFKLMYFSYDGELLREEPQYYAYNRFFYCGDDLILHTDRNENPMAPAISNNSLVLAQPDQTPLFKGFPHNYSDKFNYTIHYSLIKCKDDVYYTHVMSDTIWQIKPNGVCEAKYVFKFQGRDNLFDENDFQQITNEEYEQRKKDIAYYAGDITITDNFIRAGIFNGQPMLYCISTGHYYYGYPNNRYFDGPTSFEGKFTLDGTSFVDVLQPFQLLQNHELAKDMYNEISYDAYWNKRLTEEERQLLQNMTPEDNPILVIVDIEPF